MRANFIYEFLKLIPNGKLITYKTLANIFGLHPRQIAEILSENTKQDIYPCYKVVGSDATVGGYNLGPEIKIEKLKKDGIKIEKNSKDLTKSKILNFQQVNWQPLLFNFFVAFPLEGKEQEKFYNLYLELKKLSNDSFTLQKPSSPHITLRFFGQLSFKDFHKILFKAEKNLSKIKTNLKNQVIKFNKIENFHDTVWFYKPKSANIEKKFSKFYIQFHKAIGLPTEKRSYRPHLTVLRIKNLKQLDQIKKQVLTIMDRYDFSLKINKLRFYAAIDDQFQIPLVDIII